ncbi:D-beta-hydroxybutyrate dehydrogenase [Paraburkholderia hiiakae]|uniref:D-beta-hydroxybutyrate dehydrogenase n=1 Tax=Paraburkholderia hiiakae TaxID=1081782 RepID=A0ABM8NMY2_9BURK|nr:SDR family oxidoreductase [Paraburkholderia hiiakae]CAD6533969.1 D-beta-hydroxybutyrate dehydrogenase [Paraburkholderia hiiakae]
MKIELTGKTAVVTGSSSGIGLAIASGLAECGARTIVNGRKQDAVDSAIERIKSRVPNADVLGIACDLGTLSGVEAVVKEAPETDILVNNMGFFGPGDILSTADADWERYFQVNVMSGVRMTRAYLAGMMKRRWGRIVFISSESGVAIPPDMLAYGFTKTAQLSISRGVAKFAANSGVTVNSVLPGPTLSEGALEMVSATAKAEGKTSEQVLNDFVVKTRGSSIIRRATTTEEVANMVVYVCSPQASATTGAALRVEGGIVDSIS